MNASYCRAVSSRRQKNFEDVPDAVKIAWNEWLEEVRADNRQAGPVAMYLATKLKPQQWGTAVGEFNEWLKKRQAANAESTGRVEEGSAKIPNLNQGGNARSRTRKNAG